MSHQKRTSREVREAILKLLSDGKEYSFARLEKKIGSNWTSIREHCSDLALFGAIEVKEHKEHDLNRRRYVTAKITPQGLELLKKIKTEK